MVVDSEKHPHQASISVPPHDAQQQHGALCECRCGFSPPKKEGSALLKGSRFHKRTKWQEIK